MFCTRLLSAPSLVNDSFSRDERATGSVFFVPSSKGGRASTACHLCFWVSGISQMFGEIISMTLWERSETLTPSLLDWNVWLTRSWNWAHTNLAFLFYCLRTVWKVCEKRSMSFSSWKSEACGVLFTSVRDHNEFALRLLVLNCWQNTEKGWKYPKQKWMQPKTWALVHLFLQSCISICVLITLTKWSLFPKAQSAEKKWWRLAGVNFQMF